MALFSGTPRRRSVGWSRWRLYLQRYRTRKELLLLDDARLIDIGLSRAEALREGYKPFWKE
ncbi:DUF1127 domain-containing protein [Serratia marcescens]|uniref:DUF1127 domain-containing protein n=1 Tax=Serratia TaxID=613 RepID=UPI000D1534AC|nr:MULTISPECIES: DUF1127 domain-containing protein [Serratia]ELY1861534.1 DUF1127 domain-containing protein [Serratia marcescens]MBH2681911.1 DUF1127 domain-containing protein [Serratia marcescens]MBI6132847.1 DUF1127 domain-containing protein [Serratia marcescens]MBN5198921.1 DUF1127 domain-containing protein [Serratia marcescens]MBN5381949.1 DUF1127 domain-containing protein [Serratia marcescens]